jgi:hypothetical protein
MVVSEGRYVYAYSASICRSWTYIPDWDSVIVRARIMIHIKVHEYVILLSLSGCFQGRVTNLRYDKEGQVLRMRDQGGRGKMGISHDSCRADFGETIYPVCFWKWSDRSHHNRDTTIKSFNVQYQEFGLMNWWTQ